MDRTKVSVPHKVRINEVREEEAKEEIRSICSVCNGSGIDYPLDSPYSLIPQCPVCQGTGYDNNRT